MNIAIVNSWALLLGIGVLLIGNGLISTLLGVRANIEAFPTAVIGIIQSAYFVGWLVGSTLTPRIVRNVGHVRAFAALASLASTTSLVHALMVDPVTWSAMRFVSGLCFAGLYVVAESWLNDSATNKTRGQILSVYVIVQNAGWACGQFLLTAGDPAGSVLFILASLLVSLALIPILLTVAPAPAFSTPSAISLREIYRTSPLGLIGCVGAGVSLGTFWGLGAVFAQTIGLSIAQISAFMAAATLGGFFLQWPIGHLSDRFDRRRVLTLVSALAGAAALMAVFAAGMPTPWLIAAIALFGGLSLPTYALGVAHTNDYLEVDQIVGASGALVLAYGLGSVFGPVTASALMTVFGPNGFLLWLAGVHFAISGFAVWRMTQRQARPNEDQGTYVAMPTSTTGMAASLNPEAAPMDEHQPGVEGGPWSGDWPQDATMTEPAPPTDADRE